MFNMRFWLWLHWIPLKMNCLFQQNTPIKKKKHYHTIKIENVTFIYLYAIAASDAIVPPQQPAAKQTCREEESAGEYREIQLMQSSLSAVCLHHTDPAGTLTSLFLSNLSLRTVLQTCTCEGRATTLQRVQTGFCAFQVGRAFKYNM